MPSRRKQLWGGRFAAPPAELLERFNDSFAFDRNLLPEDIEGSIAWTGALARASVLDGAEAKRLVAALMALRDHYAAELPADDGTYEDVHAFVEAKLGESAGEVAGKLHTGRSRNDQVATDVRLYVKKALAEAHGVVLDLAAALCDRALAEAGSLMPGYTHFKQAEPVTLGHWCLAYVEMLLRDAGRLADAHKRADECPLGSGALAGTPLPIDRHALAQSLGFARPTANSLDGVSDRDAVLEYLFAVATAFVHLSRLAEDLILYSSDELGFVTLPDELATGSSRMPHKKNPDVLELARGHAGRMIGELTGLLGILKGLPLAYDKDLQLDKEPLFRARAVVAVALPVLAQLVRGLKVDHERMRAVASGEALAATALADAMTRRGVPFRTAHEIVGKRVAEAAARGTTVASLGTSEQITRQDLRALDADRALEQKACFGGTAPSRVTEAAKAAAARIESARFALDKPTEGATPASKRRPARRSK